MPSRAQQARFLAFSQGKMRPRGRPPRRNAAIRHVLGANTPCSELSWGSLSVPFCDILFFSLLASLAAATPGNVQTLMQNKLLLLSQIFLRVCLFDLFMRPSVSRQTVSFFGDTPILIAKVFFIELFTLLSLLNIPTSMPTWLFPFLALLVAVQLHPRWRATLLRPKATLRSSSRRGYLIEMFPHLIVVNSLMSIKTWLCRLLSLKVQTLLQLLSLLLLLPLWCLLSFLIVVLLLQLLSTNPVVSQFEHLRRLFFLISSLFSLLASLVASRPGKVRTLLQHGCTIDGAPHCFVPKRHSDPHPDVVFSSKCFRI